MEIILGKTAGFCFGVQNAVDKTKEQLKQYKKIYCLGELVHNKQVIEELKEEGLVFIENINEAKNKVIIRAHGAEKSTYEIAKENNIEVVDLTCPKVLHIHNIVEKYVKEDYYIFLVGQKEHPETIATISFCGNYYSVIENIDKIGEAINQFNKSKKDKVLVISQTTYSLEKFNEIIRKIEEKIDKKNIEIKNTICNATKERQEEVISIAKQVDCMIIIGGKNSSNTNKLYELAKKHCNKVIFIETKQELKKQELENINKIGIMAGASTPKNSIEDAVEILKKI